MHHEIRSSDTILGMFEIGTSLREARLRRSIDVVEAEHDTKIRTKYLVALENEDFSVLPGVVYTRGFLRTYAQYLGLDAHLYIDEYNSRFGQFAEMEEHHADVHRTQQAQNTAPHVGMRMAKSVVITVMVAVALLAWLGLRTERENNAQDSDVFSSVQKKTTESTITASPPQSSPTISSKKKVVATAPQALRVITPGTAVSWIQVRRGSAQGPIVFAGELKPNSTRSFRATKLFISIGYPPAVTLRYGVKRVTNTSEIPRRYVASGTTIRPLS